MPQISQKEIAVNLIESVLSLHGLTEPITNEQIQGLTKKQQISILRDIATINIKYSVDNSALIDTIVDDSSMLSFVSKTIDGKNTIKSDELAKAMK